MAKKWTRKERREHIRRKYYGWKEKIFAIVATVFVLFLVLGFIFSGMIQEAAVQGVSLGMIVLILLVFFLIAYGEGKLRVHAAILLVILVVLVIYSVFVALELLEGVAFVIVSIFLMLFFIVLIFILAFLVDLVAYETI